MSESLIKGEMYGKEEFQSRQTNQRRKNSLKAYFSR